ncbi:MAG TPA: hypothetical protein VGX28_15915 [Frankiaceae bacterium]|jgi:hypothetical protein|nr:hypothetical protein [Frankiaceae bacterium]
MKRPLAALVLLAAVACRGEPVIERVPESEYTPPPTTAAPSGSATVAALKSGPPSPGCVQGWREPPPGTLRSKPLDLLRQSQGLTGSFLVHDVRYFTGSDKVERWYAKVSLVSQTQSFHVRFLAERRPVGEGIVAVAPLGTKGFASPDWKGFDGEGGSVAIDGVPGRWPGLPTDFVKDGGLPADVAGCLAG